MPTARIEENATTVCCAIPQLCSERYNSISRRYRTPWYKAASEQPVSERSIWKPIHKLHYFFMAVFY